MPQIHLPYCSSSILDELQRILRSMSDQSSSLAPAQPVPHVCCIESCVLCGRIMVPGMDRRYKEVEMLCELIRTRCCPTPFVFASLLGERAPRKRVCCCIACINWVRRLSSSSYSAKIPIPIDNLLLFLQCPGAAIRRPDHRSLHRIMASLANEVAVVSFIRSNGNCASRTVRNVYLRFCTPAMEGSIAAFRLKYMHPATSSGLASRCQRSSTNASAFFCVIEIYSANEPVADSKELVEDMVRTWWESSGKPMMLTDRVTARSGPLAAILLSERRDFF